MEGFTIPSDKDFLRMAILKQESIFREQVGELHRVYRLQRVLMRDMHKQATARRGWGFTYSNSGGAYEREQGDAQSHKASDGEEVELTLAIGGEQRRRRAATEEDVGERGDTGEGIKRRIPWISNCLAMQIR